jgi:hypothetical protein
MEEQVQYPKQALDKFRQWHFWWLVVFSFLLITTFVWYLPTRFLYQNLSGEHHMSEGTTEQSGHEHQAGEEHEHGTGMAGDMHGHMDDHMSQGMDMDEMMEHMMEEHEMSHNDVQNMMDEMMGHDHEEGEGHEHETGNTNSSGEHSDGHSDVAYHEENEVKNGLAVNMNISPVPYNAGVPLKMNFFVNNKPGNVPVPAGSLQIEHEKLMHVVGLRSDMNEFFHIHPQATDDAGVFSVNHTFNKPGLYKIWSDVKKDGQIHLFGHPEVSITGAGSKDEKNVSFARNVEAGGNYQVSLISSGVIAQKREVELSFDIHSLTGQEVSVEDFLGAQMHLVLIKDDLKQFIHTHPAGHEHSSNTLINTANAQSDGHTDHMHTGGDEIISFAVTFPEPGLYKAFAQFRPQGTNLPADEAILAEFWIQVEEKDPFPVSQWWGLLLVSLVLMAGLSLVVRNYLVVKPEDIKAKV